MPWALVGILTIYGLASLVFALVKPPPRLSSLFPIPSIFVFLPDRFIVPVGRIFVALCTLGVAAFIAKQFLAAGAP